MDWLRLDGELCSGGSGGGSDGNVYLKQDATTRMTVDGNGVTVNSGYFAMATSSVSLAASDQSATTPVVIVTACGGTPRSLLLPAVGSNAGALFYVCSTDAADTCDVADTSGGSVMRENGLTATTASLPAGDCLTIVGDGTYWYVIARR